ncbi:hypothetical protein M0R04_00340 [Candidatus Dojkabacteria bacterium]|jgi:hypothetical protein|nr:hypothetical protein [Candidatus Dojkabacteria bacterium]
MLIEKLQEKIEGDWNEKKGVWECKKEIASRKAFLSTKVLNYIAKFRVDEENKEVKFSEMLMEKGSGIDGGVGFSSYSYSTSFTKPNQGGIKEQSDLFGKKYEYKFQWGEISKLVESIAKENGYTFNYSILGV